MFHKQTTKTSIILPWVCFSFSLYIFPYVEIYQYAFSSRFLRKEREEGLSSIKSALNPSLKRQHEGKEFKLLVLFKLY